MTYREFVGQTQAALAACAQVEGDFGCLEAAFAHPSLVRDGTWCEFGVAGGRTLEMIARQRGDAELWGFDSFRGLPEYWREGHTEGTFTQPHIPHPPDGVRLVVGLFDDTLPCWVPKPSRPVRFVHVDCDLYASAKAALNAVKLYVWKGTVIVFDELHNYDRFEDHEMLALYESGIRMKWFASGLDKAAGIVDPEGICR